MSLAFNSSFKLCSILHSVAVILALLDNNKLLEIKKSSLSKTRSLRLTFKLGNGDTTGDGNHRHQIKFNIQDKLEVNDKVILLRIDDKFIILDKVVSI